jgi:hypothetical protein
VYRARGRELLARTGSRARIDARFLRVPPKVRTPPLAVPAFSRYGCLQGPGIDARWHKMPARHRGTDPRSEYATMLLLPWPLVVRASDFRPVEGSVQRLTKDPFGFFEFAPAEGPDLGLLDRVLGAARREAGSVDVVVLPESAVEEPEIGALETSSTLMEWSTFRPGCANTCESRGGFRTTRCISVSIRGSRRADRSQARGANRGFIFARTSTTAGPAFFEHREHR